MSDWVRVASGGGDVRWAQDETIPDWLQFGQLVDAFTLSEIARDYGDNTAATVNALSTPCTECGLLTYGGGRCEHCERVEYGFALTATALELAGAFSPRCD